jgi:hypothetical protein
MVSAVQVHEPTLWAGRYSGLIPPYKRGVTGSNPVAPTRSGHMLILTGNIRGNHRCTPWCGNGGGNGPPGPWQGHLRLRGRVTSCYWSVRTGDKVRDGHQDLAWAYDYPTRQLLPIAGLIAFYNEKIDVDGLRLPRARTHFFK